MAKKTGNVLAPIGHSGFEMKACTVTEKIALIHVGNDHSVRLSSTFGTLRVAPRSDNYFNATLVDQVHIP
jgi:hypothetical protein